MMTRLIFVLSIYMLFIPVISATQIKPKTLKELVPASDLIVEVFVADVYGKDKYGAIIRDPDMETGPQLGNKIVINVCVKEVLFSAKPMEVPHCFEVSLWKRWHLSLSTMLEYKSKDALLLLKGESLEFVHPGHFIWPQEKKDEIVELIKKRDTE
jgi:hypothetical protein